MHPRYLPNASSKANYLNQCRPDVLEAKEFEKTVQKCHSKVVFLAKYLFWCTYLWVLLQIIY